MSALDEFRRLMREYEAEFGRGAFWRDLAADLIICAGFGALLSIAAVMIGVVS